MYLNWINQLLQVTWNACRVPGSPRQTSLLGELLCMSDNMHLITMLKATTLSAECFRHVCCARRLCAAWSQSSAQLHLALLASPVQAQRRSRESYVFPATNSRQGAQHNLSLILPTSDQPRPQNVMHSAVSHLRSLRPTSTRQQSPCSSRLPAQPVSNNQGLLSRLPNIQLPTAPDSTQNPTNQRSTRLNCRSMNFL